MYDFQKMLDLSLYLHPCQDPVGSSVVHVPSVQTVWKSVEQFLTNPGDKQVKEKFSPGNKACSTHSEGTLESVLCWQKGTFSGHQHTDEQSLVWLLYIGKMIYIVDKSGVNH